MIVKVPPESYRLQKKYLDSFLEKFNETYCDGLDFHLFTRRHFGRLRKIGIINIEKAWTEEVLFINIKKDPSEDRGIAGLGGMMCLAGLNKDLNEEYPYIFIDFVSAKSNNLIVSLKDVYVNDHQYSDAPPINDISIDIEDIEESGEDEVPDSTMDDIMEEIIL